MGKTIGKTGAGIIVPTWITPNGMVVKTELHTQGDHYVTITSKDQIVPGLTIEGGVKFGFKQGFSVGADYILPDTVTKQFNLNSISSQFYFPSNTIATHFEGGMVGTINDKTNFGIQLSSSFSDFTSTIDKFAGSIHYKQENYNFSVELTHKLTTELNLIQCLDKKKVIGASFQFNIPSGSSRVQIGTSLPLFFGEFKTTVDSLGFVGLGYKRKLGVQTITFGGRFDLLKRTPNFGIDINLSL